MNDTLKRVLLIGAVVIIGGGGIYYGWSSIGGQEELVRSANTRVLKCSETGKLVDVEISADMPPFPHENPATGKRTLYPTEVCYSKDEAGNWRSTRVILNRWLGEEEPTHCPVCGAVVRPHNPPPPDWPGAGE